MNQTTIMGHLGADPEVRFTSSGQKVTSLRVASNQRRGGKEETFWWRVTIWGEQFDKIMPYFKRGSAIIVSGEMLKPEIYTDREGHPQISLNLVAYHIAFPPFGRKESGDQFSQQSYEHSLEQTMQQGQGEEQQEKQEQSAFSEDEIPF